MRALRPRPLPQRRQVRWPVPVAVVSQAASRGSLHTLCVPHGAYNQYTCEVHELYCGSCHLFLGHAFEDGVACGDTHAEARWRHCVLSLSLAFAKGEEA